MGTYSYTLLKCCRYFKMDTPENLDGPPSPGTPRVDPITMPPSLLEDIEREVEKRKERERENAGEKKEDV